MELYHRLRRSLESICGNFEIIMINDGSPQKDWEVIMEIAALDNRVKGINLTRNFGQHSAITAGLDYARGDWIVVMDGDLQDQPEEIIKLYNCAIRGYDIVLARRQKRQDSFPKRFFSKLFYMLFDFLADARSDHTIANFSIISQRVKETIRTYREQSRFYPRFLSHTGFTTYHIDVQHAVRPGGISSYSIKRRFNLALDVIVANSNKPLRLSIKFGFLISLLSLTYGLGQIIRYYFGKRPPLGWTSVIVAIFFVGGLILANLGVIGLYIGKIYDEVKGRPLYIVKETVNV